MQELWVPHMMYRRICASVASGFDQFGTDIFYIYIVESSFSIPDEHSTQNINRDIWKSNSPFNR